MKLFKKNKDEKEPHKNTPEKQKLDTTNPQDGDGEEVYESTPEELTGFGGKNGPPWFERKKVLIAACVIFSVLVITGIIYSQARKRAAANRDAASGYAANAPRDFLRRELERSLSAPDYEDETEPIENFTPSPFDDEWGLPAVSSVPTEREYSPPPPAPVQVQPQPQPVPYTAYERQPQYQFSPLVPSVEGSLFASRAQQQNSGRQEALDYEELLRSLASPGQNPPSGDFYSPEPGDDVSGFFLRDDILWIGTVIPAVLETAINTDLPGNVLARVTQNVWDSRTGKKLLIPQGSLLFARYNNSVSYQQSRIQIVWDVLIRPDGFLAELQGMNAVDPKGMSGLEAVYHENLFEYAKAAGIISLFTLASGKLAEQAAQFGSDEMAQSVIAANAEFIGQAGAGFISRAMNIKPTLTLDSGEKISIMANRNIRLPPLDDFIPAQKYILP